MTTSYWVLTVNCKECNGFGYTEHVLIPWEAPKKIDCSVCGSTGVIEYKENSSYRLCELKRDYPDCVSYKLIEGYSLG